MSRYPHVDHVGSLLRPERLREARQRILGKHDADHNLGPHDNAELTEIENECIRDVVKLQEDCGLPFVTDGEFRRRSWWTDIVLSFTGTSVTYNGKSPITFVSASGDKRPAPGVEISQRVTWQKSATVGPFKFLQSVATTTPKVTLPGPPMIHFMRDKDFVPEVYPSLEEFWSDVIAVYRREIEELAKAGCRHIQIDECMLAWLCDPRHQSFAKARGEDPRKLVETYCWAIDQAISARPADMTVAMHSCRGNMNAYWGSEGGYDFVAETMFNRINVDYFLLEYDTPRAGDFKPLKYVPKGKGVLLGLISTKDPKMEEAETLYRKVEEAAHYLDHSQLGLCPQCGFSTNLFGTSFTEDDERRKLELAVKTADKLWS
jgi:5-methyltetrahydropteroyltriglutamate--homocysteine methyltransferase